MNKMEKLYSPVHAGKLPPRYGGILRIADQADGTSTGHRTKLTRICANEPSARAVENCLIESPPAQYLPASPRNPASEETILAIFLDCARHAVLHLTPEKLNTLTQLVPHIENTKDISTITKNL
jgi:hypothetical protein